MDFCKILRRIPNLLTGLRILGSAALLFVPAVSAAFYLLHTLCGISDLLDGFLARRLHAESRLGSTLDSTADLIFWIAAFIRLYPLFPAVPLWLPWAIGGIAAVRFAAYLIGFLRFRRFAALHTVLNKAAGFVLFAGSYFVLWNGFFILCAIFCALAGTAAAEELAIQLTASSCRTDRKSICSR